MIKKISKIIGPFPDPSDSRPDDQKFHFTYDSDRDFFRVAKAPIGRGGVGKKYYNGSKAYSTLMKFKRVWDRNSDVELVTYTEVPESLILSDDISIPKAEVTYDESGTLIFGDSQIGGNLGKKLESLYGGYRVFKNGSNPASWAPGGSNNHLIHDKLKEYPKNIFIALGGNSSSGIEKLMSYIKESSPWSEVTFFTPPPPALDGTRYQFSNHKSRRERNNSKLLSSLYSKGDINIVDLHEVLKGGYYCEGKCDGIHLPNFIVEDIFSKIT